jgi:hypothetical protein
LCRITTAKVTTARRRRERQLEEEEGADGSEDYRETTSGSLSLEASTSRLGLSGVVGNTASLARARSSVVLDVELENEWSSNNAGVVEGHRFRDDSIGLTSRCIGSRNHAATVGVGAVGVLETREEQTVEGVLDAARVGKRDLNGRARSSSVGGQVGSWEGLEGRLKIYKSDKLVREGQIRKLTASEALGHELMKGAASEVTAVGSRGVSSVTKGLYPLMYRMKALCLASAVKMEPAAVR